VRVEYVARAPVEGSDDRALLATLREGRPAPAPAGVMVASTAPFVPAFRDDGGVTPVPAERPFALGAGAGPDPAGGGEARDRQCGDCQCGECQCGECQWVPPRASDRSWSECLRQRRKSSRA